MGNTCGVSLVKSAVARCEEASAHCVHGAGRSFFLHVRRLNPACQSQVAALSETVQVHAAKFYRQTLIIIFTPR